MARPKCCRRVSQLPSCTIFKPVGVPISALDEIVLSMDEFEALRLADLEGLYQEQAAERMAVSRQTFARIVQDARRKVAQVLSEGRVLRIEGGEVHMPQTRSFVCDDCKHRWHEPFGTGRPHACPACKSGDFRRIEDQDSGTPPALCRRKQCRGRGC
jgi:uncharacterized protein